MIRPASNYKIHYNKRRLLRYDDVFTFENLHASYYHVRKGKIGRTMYIQYHMNLIHNLKVLKNKLDDETYEFGKLNRFKVYEPKEREVVADGHEDKIVQDVLSKKVLGPLLGDKMIYDNYASQPKKGTHLAVQRLERNCRRFAKATNWTGEGYVLVCDISKFFYNIDHDVCWNLIKNLPVDKKLARLMKLVIDACTEDINPYVETPGKGLCIGFQTSQWLAVYYLNGLDHFIKEKLGIKYYGRYMDDFYIIHEDREYLEYCYREIKRYVEDLLKMKLNPKTHIHPFKQGICFLGYHVTYDPATHQVVTEIRSKSINKMLKRTKRQMKMVRRGQITPDNVRDSLQSWHAYAVHGDNNKSKNAYKKAVGMVDSYDAIAEEYHRICNDWTNLDDHGFFKLKVREDVILRDVDGFAVLKPYKRSKREAWMEEKRERLLSDRKLLEKHNMDVFLRAMASKDQPWNAPPKKKPSKKTTAKRKLRSSGSLLFDALDADY